MFVNKHWKINALSRIMSTVCVLEWVAIIYYCVEMAYSISKLQLDFCQFVIKLQKLPEDQRLKWYIWNRKSLRRVDFDKFFWWLLAEIKDIKFLNNIFLCLLVNIFMNSNPRSDNIEKIEDISIVWFKVTKFEKMPSNRNLLFWSSTQIVNPNELYVKYLRRPIFHHP